MDQETNVFSLSEDSSRSVINPNPSDLVILDNGRAIKKSDNRGVVTEEGEGEHNLWLTCCIIRTAMSPGPTCSEAGINANPKLKVNRTIHFSRTKMFLLCRLFLQTQNRSPNNINRKPHRWRKVIQIKYWQNSLNLLSVGKV